MTRRTHLLTLALVLTGWLVSLPRTAAAQDLAVAAASDLQFVLPQIAERYERQTGRHVRLTFGSSGNFFAQIQNGAPFDVFLSADLEYPQRLIAGELAVGESLYEYATGRIVVWARKDSGLSVTAGLSLLATPRVRRVAIANPEHAPYGRAAIAALEHAQLTAVVRPKLVLGENITQAAQFVQSGNADVGILAMSLALAAPLKDIGEYSEIPATAHPPIRQAGVVVSASPRKEAAGQFLAFMKGIEVVRLMASYGFAVPSR